MPKDYVHVVAAWFKGGENFRKMHSSIRRLSKWTKIVNDVDKGNKIKREERKIPIFISFTLALYHAWDSVHEHSIDWCSFIGCKVKAMALREKESILKAEGNNFPHKTC